MRRVLYILKMQAMSLLRDFTPKALVHCSESYLEFKGKCTYKRLSTDIKAIKAIFMFIANLRHLKIECHTAWVNHIDDVHAVFCMIYIRIRKY